MILTINFACRSLLLTCHFRFQLKHQVLSGAFSGCQITFTSHTVFANVQHLLCARQCSRGWGCRGEQRKTPAFLVLVTDQEWTNSAIRGCEPTEHSKKRLETWWEGLCKDVGVWVSWEAFGDWSNFLIVTFLVLTWGGQLVSFNNSLKK